MQSSGLGKTPSFKYLPPFSHPETFQLVGSQSTAVHREAGMFIQYSVTRHSMRSPVCRPTGGEIEAGIGLSLPRASILGGQKKSQKRPEEHLVSLTESSTYIRGN